MKYTITIVDKNLNEHILIDANGRNKAVHAAYQACTDYPDCQIYACSSKRQNGQQVWLNKNGYDCVGKNWNTNA